LVPNTCTVAGFEVITEGLPAHRGIFSALANVVRDVERIRQSPSLPLPNVSDSLGGWGRRYRKRCEIALKSFRSDRFNTMTFNERAALLIHEVLHGRLGGTVGGIWDTEIQRRLGLTISSVNTYNITERIMNDCFKRR
jgi:hypothetical protein